MNGSLTTGLPMADYLSIDALSSGACKALATGSPFAWRNRVEQDSPFMSLGTHAHMAILEPARFADAVVQPDADLRTNAGKQILVDWLCAIVGEPLTVPPAKAATGTVLDLYLGELRPRLAASGLTVLTEDQRVLCLGMRDAVMSRPHTRAIVEADGATEITGTVTDPEYGIPIKVRPDKLLLGTPVVVSLKTCQSVADRDYLRTAWAYGWHGAAWFYARALEQITGEPHRYWEIAVESGPCHDVLLLEYTRREIEEAEAMMHRGLETYRRCTEAGIWPGAGWDWDANEYTIAQIGRKSEL
jgi:hypothetical protein